MSWNSLKAGIAAIIRANGNQEITGTNLQSVLNAMVNGLGQNATFAGVAIPSTVPGTPDGPVFYLAGRHGRYSNFGNVRFDTSNAIAVFVWDGSAWSKTELEFTVEGGGGGGGGGDIDPSIATFTSSKVTIKVPLDVWDEATFTKIFVGEDDLDVEDKLVQLLEKTRDISVSTSATTGEDIVDIETDVLIEGNLEVLEDVLIHQGVTINDGGGEVYIESGLISADGIEADAISAGTILLNRVDLGTTLTALNTKTAGISRTTSGNTNTTVVADNLEVSGGLSISGGAMIGGNVNCDDIFCGLVEAADYVTDGGLNIVTEIGAMQTALNGKQDMLPIETTSASASLNCVADKYYVLTATIGTLSITLPTMTDTAKVHTIGIYLTTGATPAITIAGTNTIKYDNTWAIDANATHEINALWNGTAWVLTLIHVA